MKHSVTIDDTLWTHLQNVSILLGKIENRKTISLSELVRRALKAQYSYADISIIKNDPVITEIKKVQ